MANSSLGLTIGIPPDLAKKLRQQSSSSNAVEEPPIPHELSSSKHHPMDKNGGEDATGLVIPCISIHLEKLIGYQPSDAEELLSIQHQLLSAMWTRYHQTTSDGQPTSDMDQPPPDFDRQVMDFFETGVARYIESPHPLQEGRLILRYPLYLQSPVTGERISTDQLVQQIPSLPPLDFLTNLWQYLRLCSQSLFWKRDMAAELTLLIREEQARLDYQEWTESKRQAKLDHLYSIRETLVHQVELAKSKVEVLEEQREIQVDEAMEPVRRNVHKKTSIDTFGTSDLSFPDEFQWLGLTDRATTKNDDNDDIDWGLGAEYSDNDDHGSYTSGRSDDELADESSTNDYSENDDNENDITTERGSVEGQKELQSFPSTLESKVDTNLKGEHASTSSTNDIGEDTPPTSRGDEKTQPSLSLPFQRRKKRREKLKQRKRQEQKAAEQKAQKQKLQSFEADLRNKFTSKELILAQTMHNALSEKMKKIEELLDSLQDEVWQAEEEAEHDQQQQPSDGVNASATRISKPTFSLLDQVLAMILGATPIPDGKSPTEHFQSMQKEHETIVQAWEAHFGRLPPPATGTTTSAQAAVETFEKPLSSKDHRDKLGIVDNDGDDWEAIEDWDNLLDEKKMVASGKSSTQSQLRANDVSQQSRNSNTSTEVEIPPPKLVGLRPGGRVVRPNQD